MFTVADFLALPAVAAARPDLLVGEDLDRRQVRWAHTSEIYEIAPLLHGGEVLLTTGLGLVGVSSDARREYVAALARVGAAALVLELGRTFPRAPADLVAAAREHGLPVIVLHSVVPFVEVTEAVHTLVIGADLEHLRTQLRMRDRLLGLLGSAGGVAALTGSLGEALGRPIELRDRDGETVAGQPVDRPVAKAQVSLGQRAWGMLLAGGPSADAADAERLGDALGFAAGLVAIELERGGTGPVSRPRAAAELVRDMLTGEYVSAAELTARAAGAGVIVRPGQRIVALCLHPRTGSTAKLLVTARTVAARQLAPSLLAAVDGEVLVATAVPARGHRAELIAFAEALRAELGAGAGLVVGASAPVDSVPDLVAALPSAIDTARIARRLAVGADVVFAPDFALYQLIAELIDDDALERFVADQLGPLLEHDARTGAGLVPTLDAYLATGMSKVRTAELLGIHRQTLYGRLERITALLGGLDLDHRDRRTALDLALVSWRLRGAGSRGPRR